MASCARRAWLQVLRVAPKLSRALSKRKTMTAQLRERSNAVEAQSKVLDRLILHFRRTPEGRKWGAAYQAARVIRDLGRRRQAVAEPEWGPQEA